MKVFITVFIVVFLAELGDKEKLSKLGIPVDGYISLHLTSRGSDLGD